LLLGRGNFLRARVAITRDQSRKRMPAPAIVNGVYLLSCSVSGTFFPLSSSFGARDDRLLLPDTAIRPRQLQRDEPSGSQQLDHAVWLENLAIWVRDPARGSRIRRSSWLPRRRS